MATLKIGIEKAKRARKQLDEMAGIADRAGWAAFYAEQGSRVSSKFRPLQLVDPALLNNPAAFQAALNARNKALQSEQALSPRTAAAISLRLR